MTPELTAAYFAARTGQTQSLTLETGKTFFTEVFARRYTLSIVGVQDVEDGQQAACFGVTSVDLVPSGYASGGTDRRLGQVSVVCGPNAENVLRTACLRADETFVAEWKDKGTWR